MGANTPHRLHFQAFVLFARQLSVPVGSDELVVRGLLPSGSSARLERRLWRARTRREDLRENPDKYRHATAVKRLNVDVDHVLHLDGERLRSQQASNACTPSRMSHDQDKHGTTRPTTTTRTCRMRGRPGGDRRWSSAGASARQVAPQFERRACEGTSEQAAAMPSDAMDYAGCRLI